MTTERFLNILTLFFTLTLFLFLTNLLIGQNLEERAYFIKYGQEQGSHCVPALFGLFEIILLFLLPTTSILSIIHIFVTKKKFRNVKINNLPNDAQTLTVITILLAILFFFVDLKIVISLTKNIATIYL